jgi:hypothetical protein
VVIDSGMMASLSADDLVGAHVRFTRHRKPWTGTIIDSLRVGGTLAFHLIDDYGQPWSAVRLDEIDVVLRLRDGVTL